MLQLLIRDNDSLILIFCNLIILYEFFLGLVSIGDILVDIGLKFSVFRKIMILKVYFFVVTKLHALNQIKIITFCLAEFANCLAFFIE